MARFSVLKKIDFKKRVFISYSEADFWIADLLHKYLIGELFFVELTFQPRYNGSLFVERKYHPLKRKIFDDFIVYSFLHTNPLLGTHFPTIIKQEIDKSKYLILLLSETSDKSTWVNFEIEYAIRQNKIILPVLLEKDAIIPNSLKNRQAILAFKKPQKWIVDIKDAIYEISKLHVADRIDFDKKTGKSLTTKESLQLLFRETYGFDIFNF